MIKDYLKSIIRNIKINKDYSFMNVAGSVLTIDHLHSLHSQLNLQSLKKITHSCDYFFSLATYIYMRGRNYETLFLANKKNETRQHKKSFIK